MTEEVLDTMCAELEENFREFPFGRVDAFGPELERISPERVVRPRAVQLCCSEDQAALGASWPLNMATLTPLR